MSLYYRELNVIQQTLRMIGYGENIGSGFPLINVAKVIRYTTYNST